jgi:DNA-binding beta-propeller fold protein YncE
MCARRQLRRTPVLAGLLASTCAAIAALGAFTQHPARADQVSAVPVFEVDPHWPRPLPNGWVLGPVSGIALDTRDHVVLVQRAESESVAKAGGTPAPHVIEFDPDGALVRAWGGRGDGYTWMEQVHGVSIDPRDQVWISGNGEHDAHLLVFTRTGTIVRQIGTPGSHNGSNDTANLGAATEMRFDRAAGEVFVSDGEQNRNHRVIVLDAETGRYKRHWGAYGAKPDDAAVTAKFDPNGEPPKQFGSAVHCLHISRDGLVYVCDRSNNRFQVFHRDGTFVREVFVARNTAGAGSVWDIGFSPDEAYMYVADGTNQKVWILRRDTYEVVGSIGGPGTAPGQFATSLHDIMVDSHGNLYTGEAAAAGRIQKFILKAGSRGR